MMKWRIFCFALTRGNPEETAKIVDKKSGNTTNKVLQSNLKHSTLESLTKLLLLISFSSVSK